MTLGWAPWKRAAMSASRRRGLASRMIGTGRARVGSGASAGTRTAAAPRASASSMKVRPSARVPGSAANSQPGSTRRESAVKPRMSISPGVACPCTSMSAPSMRSLSRTRLFRGRAYRHEVPALRLRRLVRDRFDAQQRRHALDDAPDRRRRHPAGRRVAVRAGVRLGLVDYDEDRVARRVHRKGRDEGSEARIGGITLAELLLRRPGLAADEVARNVGGLAGAALDDEAHELADIVRGLLPDDAAAAERHAGVALHDGDGTIDAAVDEAGDAGDEMQRRHGDALAVGDGQRVDRLPVAGI